MEYRFLGNTGLKVSRLCFGALTIGPLQANLSVPEGAAVIRRALESGVNFIDTAQFYKTYPYIKEALRGYKGEVIIASKSYAYTARDMQNSLEEALRELNRDVIDIFMLHEQETYLTLKGHWEAVEYLLQAKQAGLIRAIGVSTHAVACVTAAAKMKEFDIIFPMINYKGIGIQDGTLDDMLAAIKQARLNGQGIMGMKPLGGGNLINERSAAFAYVLGLEELDSIALGMKSPAEVDMNVHIFNGQKVPQDVLEAVSVLKRHLHIEDWCTGCGKCVARCQQKALYLEENKAHVRAQDCVLCGYCSAVCPDFCIKII